MGNVSGSASFYKLGEEAEPEDKKGWSIYEGTSTKDGTPISVFRFTAKGKTKDQTECASHLMQQSKRLRHPYFLKFYEGREVANELAFATEKVVPLLKWVEKVRETETPEHFDAAITWGLYCLFKAISFLNENCSLVHGNVCPDSIFVNEQGDWKLGGLSLVGEGVSRLKDFPNWLEIQYKSPERVSNDWSTMSSAPKWSIDAWGVGCIIFEVFNGRVSDGTELLKIEKIPKQYQKLYKSLLSSTPGKRVNPATLTTHRMFAAHSVVKNMLFLEELHVKAQEEKLAYFRAVPSELHSYPGPAKVKLLDAIGSILSVQPTATMNGAAIPGVGALHAAVLVPMLLVGKNLSDETFKRRVEPRIVELFSSNDRGTRVTLLQNIDSFMPRLEESIINQKLFGQLCTGFVDTATILRELTIKSMVAVAPKLSKDNLETKLLKKFAMLQGDKDPAIRTNILICLSMIFPRFSAEAKKSVLLGSFVRAMQDPFHHARLAAVKGIAANMAVLKDSPDQVTAKVLPLVCVALGDPSPPVREVAFGCMTDALPWLQTASQARAVQQEKEAALAAEKAKEAHEADQRRQKSQAADSSTGAGSATTSAAGPGIMKQAAGWAVSSLASRWTSGSTGEGGQAETEAAGDKVGPSEPQSTVAEDREQVAELRRKQLAEKREEQRKKREARKAELAARRAAKASGQSANRGPAPSAGAAWDDDDDDVFKDNESSVQNVVSSHSTDDFFAQVTGEKTSKKDSGVPRGMTLKGKKKTGVTKLSDDVVFDEDEWDKW